MRTIRLEAKPDHIMRLAGLRDPVKAVAELVWNGLDAEADTVSVHLTYNDLGGVDSVSVVDNGHGMNSQECTLHFSGLGGSWKSTALVSPNLRRPLHGRAGQGRLRAFALGNAVSWTTVAEAVTGGRERTRITGKASTPANFAVEDPAPTEEETGTVFESHDPAQYVNRLAHESTPGKLAAVFALYLLSNPTVAIHFNGERLDPSAAWLDSTELTFDVPGNSHHPIATLRIIEWRAEVQRNMSLCDSMGVELGQLPPGIQAAGHHFTAYVSWDGFVQHRDAIALADFDEDPELKSVIESARDLLRHHFRDRDTIRRRRQIEEWKSQNVYPYETAPDSPAAAAERGLFDEVATSVARQLPKSKIGQKATLRLLREVVARDPEDVMEVVDELFKLNRTDQEDLNRLLKETSLSSVVKATTQVTGRLKFLAALRTLIFEPDIRKVVKERSELHKILERETWVFGEQYAPMVSDQSLDAVLRRHLEALGHSVDSATLEPVRREDGSVGIVDLLLGRASRGSQGREHLIVELKAPRVKIGQKEVGQIKEYAEAVVSDPQFDERGVSWDFWVVSTELSSVVRQDAESPKTPPGCVSEWENGVRIWARTWSEIIDECESRLHYYRDCLNFDAAAEESLDHLRRFHGDNLPELLRDREGPAA
ncbi:ATP-binding protein [Pseudonocardia adelaidensis]|uniref:ATP-binding protein n=1 Tax=Pseudonocardia adelaidensis TaxID=648754 RepID=A0ABP9NPJ1_9PSEU